MSFTNPTEFSSISAIQNYFHHQHELPIPSEQPFIIKNISQLKDSSISSIMNQFILDHKPQEATLFLLNHILQPLAKTASFQTTLFNYSQIKVNESFFITCSTHTVIKVTKGPISTRLKSLFNLMMDFSIYRIEFDSNQTLTFQEITQEETQSELMQGIEKIISNIIVPHTPVGYDCKILAKNNMLCTSWNVNFLNNRMVQRNLLLSASEGMILQLSDSYLFKNIEEFRTCLFLKKEIRVFPNKMLRIEDPYLKEIWKEYRQNLDGICSIYKFALNQIMLPLSKTVSLPGIDLEKLEVKIEDEALELSHPKGFLLRLTEQSIFTNLSHLIHALFENNQQSLKLGSNQVLRIYAAKAKELDTINMQFNLNKFQQVLSTYIPEGFISKMFFDTVMCEPFYLGSNKNLKVIDISSYQGLELKLEKKIA